MLLEVEDIHCYYGLSHVVHGVSLTLDAGEVVSLLGRNGAGKTTTIQAIMGLVRPRTGTIRLANERIDGRPAHDIYRRGVGWVPQGRRLFPHLSVADNIRLATLRLDASAARAGSERVQTLFPILRERAAVSAGALSGGEQQMLAIARALVSGPRILLLDEPTEGLSPRIVRELMAVIGEVAAAGVGVLLAEQNVHVALRSAERHYILENGEVRVSARGGELAAREDLLVRHLGVSAQSGATPR